jgi:gas vesicle protein
MSNSTSDTFLALLIGAAIGVGVGILFAPDKGTTTRQKIKDTFDESGENVLKKFNDVISKIQNKASDAKSSLEESLEEMASEGSYKTEELITLLEQKLKVLKEQNAKFQK